MGGGPHRRNGGHRSRVAARGRTPRPARRARSPAEHDHVGALALHRRQHFGQQLGRLVQWNQRSQKRAKLAVCERRDHQPGGLGLLVASRAKTIEAVSGLMNLATLRGLLR